MSKFLKRINIREFLKTENGRLVLARIILANQRKIEGRKCNAATT